MRYLKIKDNIDLKELEKFGFHIKLSDTFMSVNFKNKIWVNVLTLKIITDNFVDDEVITKLYDLIKADMVEVVEEKEGN